MRFTKTSFLYRYVLSYILVLFIPVIAFVMFANARFIGVLNEERIRNNENMLHATMHNSDTIITNLNNLHLQFFFDRRIIPFVLVDEITTALNSIQLLNTISQANRFIFEIAIHFFGDDFIYTSQSSYSLRLFHEVGFVFSKWSKDEFLQDINNISLPEVRASEMVLRNSVTRADLVTFLYPLHLRVGSTDAIVMFMVEDSFFVNPAYSDDDDAPTASFILDNQGNIIVSNLSSDSLLHFDFLSFDFESLLQNPHDIPNSVQTISGENFLTTTLVSPQTGWQYVSFTPLSSVMALTTRIRNEMLAVLLAILSIAAVAIYIGIRSNYHPFAKLSEFASHYHDPDKNLNEIETVRETIQYLDQRNTEIIKSTSTASEEYVLRRLLFGFTFDKQEMKRVMSDFGIEFVYPFFVVIHMYGVGDMGIFTQHVKNAVRSPFTGYTLSEHTNQSLLVILNFDPQQLLDFSEEIEKLHKAICENVNAQVSIGVGNVYDNLSDISKSYTEARFASNYRFVRGENAVIFTDEIMDADSETDIRFINAPEKFKRLLHQNDGNGIKQMLQSFLNDVKQSGMSAFKARRLCHDMLNVITQTATSFGIDEKIYQDDLLQAEKQSELGTIDEVISQISNICQTLCKAIKDGEITKISQIDHIKTYIHANYTDANFSMQALADSLDMGVTNLSQYFKKKTGQTLVDYVIGLRMEHAKTLLKMQKHKLDDIAGMTGYLNTSSFIRRFKQYYGITPGQYAKEDTPDTSK